MLPYSTYRVIQLAWFYTSVIQSLESKQQTVHSSAAECYKSGRVSTPPVTVSNRTAEQRSRYAPCGSTSLISTAVHLLQTKRHLRMQR
jgi:hypothetical protein